VILDLATPAESTPISYNTTEMSDVAKYEPIVNEPEPVIGDDFSLSSSSAVPACNPGKGFVHVAAANAQCTAHTGCDCEHRRHGDGAMSQAARERKRQVSRNKVYLTS
jgi:hypothetical protein